MRITIIVASWLFIVSLTTQAIGHGNPIEVNVADGHLTAAKGLNGLALTNGFARFASDPHEDAALDFAPNQKLRSVYPGYDIAGLAPNAALQFEIISRPDFSTPGHPTRWLWFWNPATQAVETAASDPEFDVVPLFGSGSIQVRQSNMISGPTLTMAESVGPFLGADQHLLIYELQNSPAASLGVYGIFARLASPGLEPSEPFLLAFRYGVQVEDFAVAAEAINFAATLPGDYNHDDVVNAADYESWRAHFGQSVSPHSLGDGNGSGIVDAADYVLWRNSLNVGSGAGASQSISAVPEPANLTLIFYGVVLFLAWFCLSPRKPTCQTLAKRW